MPPVGILWLDDSARPLEQKIADAARRYFQKFGRPATICFVHPSVELPGPTVEVGGHPIRVEHRRWILPDHLWVGDEA